jgi:thiamine pyrophosphokinase
MPAEGYAYDGDPTPPAGWRVFCLTERKPMKTNKTAVIFVNGELNNAEKVRRWVESADLIVAADGGLRHALALTILPHLLIGDLDSVSPSEVSQFKEAGREIIQFPPEKNETDLELALFHIIQLGYQKITLIGALGGRSDQMVANLLLLSDPQLAGLDIRLVDDKEEVFIIRKKTQITGKPGDRVSLLPLSETVQGVTTTALLYPLLNETLYRHKTRGVSNEMISDIATIQIQEGLVLCFHSLNE